MNIFGIGGAELVLILIIMLVVAGPQRMIRWAYILGRYLASIQRMWQQAASVLQKEFDDAGVEVQVPKNIPTKSEMQRSISNVINREVDDVTTQLKEDAETMRKATQFTTPPRMAGKQPAPKPKTPVENPVTPTANGSSAQANASSAFGTWSNTDTPTDQGDAS